VIFLHGIDGGKPALGEHLIDTADAVMYVIHNGAVEIPKYGSIFHKKNSLLSEKISRTGKSQKHNTQDTPRCI
jgi:hypothetical protein